MQTNTYSPAVVACPTVLTKHLQDVISFANLQQLLRAQLLETAHDHTWFKLPGNKFDPSHRDQLVGGAAIQQLRGGGGGQAGRAYAQPIFHLPYFFAWRDR